jgi:hypothetical protein
MMGAMHILPGSGRCPAGAEGPGAIVQTPRWWRGLDPSVASRHLPVPGRI